jgi:hypothetical protein
MAAPLFKILPQRRQDKNQGCQGFLFPEKLGVLAALGFLAVKGF